MSKLEYKDFETFVTNRILDFLPYKYADAEVKISPMKKLGASYTALSVIRDTNSACPAINMDQFYDQYCNGKELSKILPEMAKIIRENQLNVEIDWVNNYENVREKLFIRVSNAEQNRELLKNVPHELVNDFAITCHLLIDQTYGSMQSAIITNNLLKSFEISEEQLFEDAMQNSQLIMPATIKQMKDILGSLEDISISSHSLIPLLVVTNEVAINGAAAFFYPDTMEKISEQMEGDYYMIPSSIHEVIVAPVTETVDPVRLQDTLHYVNECMVEPSDVLGTEIYRYNSLEKVLEEVPINDYELNHGPIVFC